MILSGAKSVWAALKICAKFGTALYAQLHGALDVCQNIATGADIAGILIGVASLVLNKL